MRTISMAFRNLSRQKRRTILLASAIAFGVLVVTVVNGLSGALVGNISANVANLAAGHIFVDGMEKSESGKDLTIVRDDTVLMDVLKKTGIPYKYISKRSESQATLVFEGKSMMQSVTGVDFAKETYMFERLALKDGSFDGMKDERGIILSDPVAKKLKVEPGDTILVELKTYTGQQNVGDFVVAATVHDAGLFSSISTYTNLSYLNKLLNIPEGQYQAFGIFIDSLDKMNAYADTYYAELRKTQNVFDRDAAKAAVNPFQALMKQAKKETWEGPKYRIFTLNDILKQIDTLVANINMVAFVFLIIIFLIIMVGLGNTFRMIMFERIREIGTMRAIGMQRKEVRDLFLWEAVLLALLGTVAGVILAWLLLSGFSLIDFGVKNDFSIVMQNGHMTSMIDPVTVVVNLVLIAAMTLLAVVFPARKSSRMPPAEALRTSK